MTQSEVNRVLAEKILKKCDHDRPFHWDEYGQCLACAAEIPDFSQWAHYGPLLEKIQGEGYWRELAYRESAQGCFRESLLNPTRGSLAIAEFVVANPQIFVEVK